VSSGFIPVVAPVLARYYRANISKCTFAADKLIFLGFVVSSNGVEVDEAKIEAIRSPPFPTSLEELRRFMGFAGFYRRFIKKKSTIACPLHDLT